MKIAHVGLASYYTDGMTYQDNQLAEQNARDGHEVLYIANAAKYVDGKVVETGREKIVLDNGIHLIRLPYERFFNRFASNKFRKVKGLYQQLEDFAPDVILSHDLCYWSVLDVIRYKKDHPAVKLYADTHTATYNSGTNWLSLHVLHRGLYRYLTQKALPYLEKYLYIGEGERQFSIRNYGVPESLMEFYPLGGTILSDSEYQLARNKRRTELNMANNELLLVHSGKLDKLKRTDELLQAFSRVPKLNAKLAIIGSIPTDRRQLLTSLIKADNRIVYLGWKSGAELLEYLCACDLYCQPGSASATMQNAVCQNCPLLLYPLEPYVKNLNWGNILWVQTEDDIVEVFQRLQENPTLLEPLRKNSHRCAQELLDYRKLAARLFQ